MDLKARLIAVSKEILLSKDTPRSRLNRENSTLEKKSIKASKRNCRGCEAIRNFFFR